MTAYERTDDPGSYEPQNGWFRTSRDYRITDASGELDADPESGTVTRADVTFHRTVADSYLEYVANRDDGVRTEITYELRPNSAEVETPDWVEDARS